MYIQLFLRAFSPGKLKLGGYQAPVETSKYHVLYEGNLFAIIFVDTAV